MSITPELKRYAEMRVARLNDKLALLYRQPKTIEVRKSIKSSQFAVRRWEAKIRG